MTRFLSLAATAN